MLCVYIYVYIQMACFDDENLTIQNGGFLHPKWGVSDLQGFKIILLCIIHGT